MNGSPANWDALRLLDAPVWFTLRHLWPMAAMILPVRLVAVAPSTIGQALTWGVAPQAAGPAFWLGTALTWLGALTSAVVMGALYAAVAHQVGARLAGRPATTRESWAFALRPAVIATTAVVILLVALGWMMCFVPGLFAAALLGLTLPVMVEEGRLGGAALDRALELARHGRRGRWFTSTGALVMCAGFAWSMIGSAVGSLVTLPVGVMAAAVGVKAATSGEVGVDPMTMLPGWLAVVTNLGTAVLAAPADLYLVAALALLHRRAVDLLEGRDLEAAIAGRSADAGTGGAP
ncbi:hypothetical protein L6R53_27860 [Myxococcota bacterium]|nr:hypothetical protein [Myxococcota bacterium]